MLRCNELQLVKLSCCSRDLALYTKGSETPRSLICLWIAKQRKIQKPKPRTPIPAIPRNPPPLQTMDKYVTMKTAFEVAATATITGAITFANINIASVNDPMGSLGTRRPYGSAILFEMYKYATVLSANVKLTAQGPYGDTAPIVVLLALQNTSSASSTITEAADLYETALRLPGSRVKMFGNYITKSLDTNNSISGSYEASKYFGNLMAVQSDPAYASTDGANPTNSVHLGVYWTTPVGSAVTSAAMSFICELTQVVRWWGNNGLDN